MKSDALAFVLGSEGRWLSVREATQALGYRERPVRAALDDLAAARFIQSSAESPVRFRARQEWGPLLGTGKELPPWRWWHDWYGFLTHALEWLEREAVGEAASPFVASSEARSLVERHWGAFERNGVQVPRTRDHLGETYLTAFSTTIKTAIAWMSEAV
jgi:hypothetical protein